MPIDKTCERCGQAFKVRPKDAGQRFCSITCVRESEAEIGRPAAQVPLLHFACKQCGKDFGMKPSIVAALRKKWGRDPLYCSMPCSDLGRRAAADARNKFTCLQCGTLQSMRRRPSGTLYREQKFCNRKCQGLYRSALVEVHQ